MHNVGFQSQKLVELQSISNRIYEDFAAVQNNKKNYNMWSAWVYDVVFGTP